MISLREITRAGTHRFLPSAAGLIAALMFVPVIMEPSGYTIHSFITFLVELAGMTGGFLGALAVMHNRLDRSANVLGRRTVIAAVLSVVAIFALPFFIQGFSMVRIIAATASFGALSGFAMYWPWMRRDISERELLKIENADLEALAEANYEAGKRRTAAEYAESNRAGKRK